MQEITLKIREVHQTGGDHVVIFDADIQLIADTTAIEIQRIGSHDRADDEDTTNALQHIRTGIEEVLQPHYLGAFVIISNLLIHPIDYRADHYRRYTTQYLTEALTRLNISTEHLI